MNLTSRARLQDGFTLVEVLVVSAIMVVIFAAITDFFVSGLNQENAQQARINAEEQARTALARLRLDAHQACSATVPVTVPVGTMVQFTLPNATTFCASGTTPVTWCAVASGTSYVLYRQYNSASCSSNAFFEANSLSSSSIFSYLARDAGSVGSLHLAKLHVDLQLTSSSGGASGSYRLVDDLVLRNS